MVMIITQTEVCFGLANLQYIFGVVEYVYLDLEIEL